jgi:DNA-binding LacI/PurR family transcriptional regulator
MKVTIADVAKRAKVSKTTVSRILNGNYAHASEETIKKVLKAIEELDYSPNALAKGLKSMRTHVIGLVLSNLKNPFWTTVLEGLEDTCRDLGYHLMICNSNEDPEMEEKYLKSLRERQVDGVILNPTCKNPQLYEKLAEQRYPFVFINRRVQGVRASSVVVDNVKGAYIAVNHLVRYGRRKVAICIYRNEYVSTWKDRLEGYKKAILANGMTDEDLIVIELEQHADNQQEVIMRQLKKRPEIDAIFSTNNMITLEVIGAARELGLAMPDQLALVSYDETVWARYLDPPVTTIRQPGYKLGQTAAQTLIDRITSGGDGEPSVVMLEPELIVRASCGAMSFEIR